MGSIVVCGLGPAGEEYLTTQTRHTIESGESYFRTLLHPAARVFQEAGSFDSDYSEHETFEETYQAIANKLIDFSSASDDIVYVTPGSPLVQEDVVRLLIESPDCDVELVPAMSFLDLAWNRLQIDPINNSVQLLDGQNFADHITSSGPKLISQIYSKNILTDIKLAIDDPEQPPAILLANLGCEDELITEVAWQDLDRVIEPNNLTSLYVPATTIGAGYELTQAVELITRLRSDCPWDAKQTHQSLIKYLTEESGEVIEAIESLDEATGEGYEELEEELGDLLLQVLLHSELAKEQGRFDIYNVAETLFEKMVRRHPHVFGDSQASTDDELAAQWASIKAAEKGQIH